MKLKKRDYLVRPIDKYTARIMVEKWHYSGGASKTGVYTHGLFLKEKSFFDEHCLGVAWWLPPIPPAAKSAYPEGNWKKVLALTRLVINPDVPKNGASFLLGNSIKLINKNEWHCLITFADTYKNHTGAIYRATNWEYLGKGKPTPVFVNAKGKIMGKKRGGKNLTTKEMRDMGFNLIGYYPKHKFKMIINKYPSNAF